MIEFECPECGESMEIKSRMAGKKIRCIECDKSIEVPAEPDTVQPRRRSKKPADLGLSSTQFVLFGLLFLLIPGANALISSLLYYIWRGWQPKRANQINMLGFAIFAFHILLFILAIAISK